MANRARLRTVDTLLTEYLENPFPEAADSKTLPAAASPASFALSLPALCYLYFLARNFLTVPYQLSFHPYDEFFGSFFKSAVFGDGKAVGAVKADGCMVFFQHHQIFGMEVFNGIVDQSCSDSLVLKKGIHI